MSALPVRTLDGSPALGLTHEWLVTNGLGGYASGTIAGIPTRRYHALLIAALPPPHGRVVLLNHLLETAERANGSLHPLTSHEQVGQPVNLPPLANFRLEGGLPVWRFRLDTVLLEKWIFAVHGQNTIVVGYRLLEGDEPIRLELRPALYFRGHHDAVGSPAIGPYRVRVDGAWVEVAGEDAALPPLRLRLTGVTAAFGGAPQAFAGVRYRVEEGRGYDFVGGWWSPGRFELNLTPGQEAFLVASTGDADIDPPEAHRTELARRERLLDQAPPVARSEIGAELTLAADAFVITPVRSRAEERRTIIAGYPWFSDWGRDTMISLEGLTLTTGRFAEARSILATFADHIRDGLIPNLFPEGESDAAYHTADATLWYFHALDRYLAHRWGEHSCLPVPPPDCLADLLLQTLLPRLEEIIAHYLRGTRFGIGVDSADGLLRQGAPGYQLTWMDAKVGDWVVTPRRGKAVELNGLWYNALRLMELWTGKPDYAQLAEQVHESFNRRFWHEAGGYLYDVVDGEQGDDAACRPNQLLAISPRFPVLAPERWPAVVRMVHERLWTPMGLRSLAPGSPEYRPRYAGDLATRDAAYHQGTVWAWLIGPFVDAWLRAYPDDRTAGQRFLAGLVDHLGNAGVGSISEVFDAEPPFTPEGCFAQAWSVAEVLRSWVMLRLSEPEA